MAGHSEIVEVTYEGYGPGGAAVLACCLTGDPAGTGDLLRRAFADHGGYLGAAGSVAYLFDTLGVLVFPGAIGMPQLLEPALAAGAEDVVAGTQGDIEVLVDPRALAEVRAALDHAGFRARSAAITRRAAACAALDADEARDMARLLDALDGIEEVRDVYSNARLPERPAAAMAAHG